MTLFRPCIDLHDGKVKQIVGGTLSESETKTNYVSDRDAAWYAVRYRDAQLCGGHVISLGQGNKEQALLALAKWPGGMQYGGGITAQNAPEFLEAGASHVIVTSYVFEGASLSIPRLESISKAAGKDRLVLDLSCRRVDKGWRVASNRWQTITDTPVNTESLQRLAEYCAEFLVHAADVEGLQQGIDDELVELLGASSPIPVTYAGGARSVHDLHRIKKLSNAKVDLTIGSALDIFGGSGVTLQECIDWNNAERSSSNR